MPSSGPRSYGSNEADSLLSKSDMIYDGEFDPDHSLRRQIVFQLPSWWPFPPHVTHVIIKIVSALAIVISLIFVFDYVKSQSNQDYTSRNGIGYGYGHKDSSPIQFTAHVMPYEPIASLQYLPWDAIIEPYRVNVANISSVTLDGVDYTFASDSANKKSHKASIPTMNLHISWNIDGVEHSGANIAFKVDKVGSVPFTVTVTDKKHGTSVKKSFTVMSRYVRREIRSLTNTDREEVLSALHIMYTTPSRTGASKYGAAFRSGEQLVYKHLTASGTTDCDHFHDGAGIATNHAAFTLEAERSMQVSPQLMA